MYGPSIAILSSFAAYASPAMAFGADGSFRRAPPQQQQRHNMNERVSMNALRDIVSDVGRDSWMNERMEMDMNMDGPRHHPDMGPGGPAYFDPRWEAQPQPPFEQQYEYDPSNPYFDPAWAHSRNGGRAQDMRMNGGPSMERNGGRAQDMRMNGAPSMERNGGPVRDMRMNGPQSMEQNGVPDDMRMNGEFMEREFEGQFDQGPYGYEPWGEEPFYPEQNYGYGP